MLSYILPDIEFSSQSGSCVMGELVLSYLSLAKLEGKELWTGFVPVYICGAFFWVKEMGKK